MIKIYNLNINTDFLHSTLHSLLPVLGPHRSNLSITSTQFTANNPPSPFFWWTASCYVFPPPWIHRRCGTTYSGRLQEPPRPDDTGRRMRHSGRNAFSGSVTLRSEWFLSIQSPPEIPDNIINKYSFLKECLFINIKKCIISNDLVSFKFEMTFESFNGI